MQAGAGEDGDVGVGLAHEQLELGAAEDDPARKAAEQAVEKLRAGRKPVDDFKNLRRELTSLKQSNSKLIKELDNLKKRFDAAIGKKKAEKK